MLEELSPEKKKTEDETDDDIEYVMQVDNDSVGRVDDIIKSLKLLNYKVVSQKKI